MRIVILLLLGTGLVTQVHAAEGPPEATPAPEWDAIFNRADGWIGGDAIYSTPLPGGDILWLFADTYIGRVRDGRRQQGVKMVNNTLARHPRAPAGEPPRPDTIEFLWGTLENSPAAWIRPDPKLRPADTVGGKRWYWLADAIVAQGPADQERLLVFLWRMAPTNSKVFAFRNAGTALAVIDNPRAEWHTWQPQQFDVTHARVATDSPQGPIDVVWGSEIILDSSATGQPRLFIYGYRQRKNEPNELILAQVPADKIEQMDCWRFRVGDDWSPDADAATALTTGITTEFSVSRIDSAATAEWILVQSAPLLGDQILIRRASMPWGPWSRPVPVYRVPNLDKSKRHFTYASKAHPELSKPGELLISYVVNSFDFAESSTNADIYRPRFIRLMLDTRKTSVVD